MLYEVNFGVDNMENLIKIEGLSKLRVHGNTSFELRVDSLAIGEGEFVGLVGDSGSGKSTLLDMLALVLSPTDAEHFEYYFTNGEPLKINQYWRTNSLKHMAWIRGYFLGYVLQSGGLLPFLTVEENIYLPFKIKNKKIDIGKIDAMAKELGIRDLYSKKPQFLSGGQRQRVAILRALAHQPKLILADEPTAAVDSERATQIVKRMKSIATNYGTTVVMVTHDLKLVNQYTDRIYRLNTHLEGSQKVISKLSEFLKEEQPSV